MGWWINDAGEVVFDDEDTTSSDDEARPHDRVTKVAS